LKEILQNTSKPALRPPDEEEISALAVQRSFERSWLT
jgi:hypothetical protein